MQIIKHCPVCHIDKDISLFGSDKRKKDKHDAICLECRRDYKKRNREKLLISQRARRKDNDDYRMKHSAHNAVLTEIRAGRMTRPDKCSRCGAKGTVEAHHQDYDKPIDIVWLCVQCHAKEHSKMEI